MPYIILRVLCHIIRVTHTVSFLKVNMKDAWIEQCSRCRPRWIILKGCQTQELWQEELYCVEVSFCWSKVYSWIHSLFCCWCAARLTRSFILAKQVESIAMLNVTIFVLLHASFKTKAKRLGCSQSHIREFSFHYLLVHDLMRRRASGESLVLNCPRFSGLAQFLILSTVKTWIFLLKFVQGMKNVYGYLRKITQGYVKKYGFLLRAKANLLLLCIFLSLG